MDPVNVANENNHEEKTEEMRLIAPVLPMLTITPVETEQTNGILTGPESVRTRRSFNGNQDFPVIRRPSAIVSAFRPNRRASSSGSAFIEYVCNILTFRKIFFLS